MFSSARAHLPRISRQRNLTQVLKFGVVGVAATAAHASALTAAVQIGKIDETIANGAAFLVAALVTYLGQSLWVFGVRDAALTRIRRFIVVASLGFAANVAIMELAVAGLNLHYLIGFLAATTLIPALTFVANKIWVFRQTETRTL